MINGFIGTCLVLIVLELINIADKLDKILKNMRGRK